MDISSNMARTFLTFVSWLSMISLFLRVWPSLVIHTPESETVAARMPYSMRTAVTARCTQYCILTGQQAEKALDQYDNQETHYLTTYAAATAYTFIICVQVT